MNRLPGILKPLMPIIAAVYGFAIIFVTALPMSSNASVGGELLSMLLTLAGIGLTLFLVKRVEPKWFTSVRQFTLKIPKWPIIIGLFLIAPLWLVAEGYLVYGLTSLFHTVQLETLTYTTSELREDLIASIHAVLLAPVLEELCFRQMAISPFRRRWAQIAVCVVMGVLFGLLHVRNFPGAFLSAMVYGLVFIWSRNIWYGIVLHAGHNLTATLLALYCWLELGDIQMAKVPVIFLVDAKVIVGNIILAAVGVLLIRNCGVLPAVDAQIERIKQMEQHFDKVLAVINGDRITPEMLESIKEDIAILDEYYSSKLWKQDFADDEAGRLPAGLKRGVLSEDGIWNLLSDYEDIVNDRQVES